MVTRVDSIGIPVDDIGRAKHLYGEVPGLSVNARADHHDRVEYEASKVTLAVMTPETHDYEFAELPRATIALGVPDVAAAKAGLEANRLEAGEMWDYGACNGAGVSDPVTSRILLHHRHKPRDEV